jgi:hypothetical protein
MSHALPQLAMKRRRLASTLNTNKEISHPNCDADKPVTTNATEKDLVPLRIPGFVAEIDNVSFELSLERMTPTEQT